MISLQLVRMISNKICNNILRKLKSDIIQGKKIFDLRLVSDLSLQDLEEIEKRIPEGKSMRYDLSKRLYFLRLNQNINEALGAMNKLKENIKDVSNKRQS